MKTGTWNSETVIPVSDSYFSIEQLRAAAESGTPTAVNARFTNWDRTRQYSFYACLAASLLHFFVDLEWVPHSSETGSLWVRSASTPVHSGGSFHLPPLFAVDYRSDESLARMKWYLNARHPLAQWILTHAETLATDFPAPFKRIFSRANSSVNDVDEVNRALERVAKSKPEIAPPAGAYLREDKEGRWWSRDAAVGG